MLHERESASVFGGVSAYGKGNIVAAIFAFGADALAKPPNCRMIKEKGFGSDLKEIDKSIEAADVGKFMRNHGAKLEFGQPAECGDR